MCLCVCAVIYRILFNKYQKTGEKITKRNKLGHVKPIRKSSVRKTKMNKEAEAEVQGPMSSYCTSEALVVYTQYADTNYNLSH